MDKHILEINDKYLPLWENEDWFIALVTGGRGSSKSFTVGDFIENLSFEKDHKILYTRYTLDSAEDSIIPEFVEKIELEEHDKHFHVTKKDVINKESGSEILFRGIKTSSGNQTAKLKSIEGLTTWVLEEAEELTDKETYDKIKQSIRKKDIKNRIILILNPSDTNHWIYKEFFEPFSVEDDFNGIIDNVLYIHSTYLDNIDNLNDEFIKEAEKCKKYTPFIYDNQYLGKWIKSKHNAIFKLRDLKRYSELNDEGANLLCIDTADEGKDHFAGLIGKYLNGNFYVTDAIYNTANLTVNEVIASDRIKKHNIDNCYIETNSFGMYFLRRLRELNPNTPVTGQRTKANKMGRILAQSGFILEFFHWPDNPTQELKEFINQMIQVTPESKDNDDAADCTALMSAWIRQMFRL
jgi:PBSX family phage terminase large subunit